MREAEVLIVGGGPVGLTASILLSRLGVRTLLVERHPDTVNARTMEIFRQCGVEAAVRAAGLAPEQSRFTIWARSLVGEELERRVPARSRAEALQARLRHRAGGLRRRRGRDHRHGAGLAARSGCVPAP